MILKQAVVKHVIVAYTVGYYFHKMPNSLRGRWRIILKDIIQKPSSTCSFLFEPSSSWFYSLYDPTFTKHYIGVSYRTWGAHVTERSYLVVLTPSNSAFLSVYTNFVGWIPNEWCRFKHSMFPQTKMSNLCFQEI